MSIIQEGSPGKYGREVNETLRRLDREHVPRRIWQKDYTLWSPQPAEITDRLGWLTVSDLMRPQLPALEAFAGEVRREGFSNVVLLGMGGSSLGAEVLNRVLGNVPGYPRLIVLDSTVPEAVASVRREIEPSRTLFLVSSKSGTTAETSALFSYFRSETEREVGAGYGRNFAAITDGGSSLEKLAREQGFRHVFDNPSDIGGRYSVLSYFGLVPAVLAGIDISRLLDAADDMRGRCAPDNPPEKNEGCRLGAYLGALANRGRDKVTFIASPALENFGLWAEQLIAESTGKQGKGIIPVVREPRAAVELYGNDRFFVYLRLDGDDNSMTDAFVEAVKAAGHPAVVLQLKDRWELGAAFYLWEFAVVVAGVLLGINPFDQPDVQRAKEATGKVLRRYLDSGTLPCPESYGSVAELIAQAREGDYLAIMAYIRQTRETDDAFNKLRRDLLESRHVATTLGYGPRFLHSTGQLHKGGPDKGLFLQVTSRHEGDVPVPGLNYSFGIMSDAEAIGDFEALKALGRRTASMRLEAVSAGTISKLMPG